MNLQYHIYTPQVQCPYCDEFCRDDDYSVELESKTVFECEHCGKNFFVESTITYCSYSNCHLNGKEHDWYLIDINHNHYHCNNCYEYKIEEK
jgi:hypothetical protein